MLIKCMLIKKKECNSLRSHQPTKSFRFLLWPDNNRRYFCEYFRNFVLKSYEEFKCTGSFHITGGKCVLPFKRKLKWFTRKNTSWMFVKVLLVGLRKVSKFSSRNLIFSRLKFFPRKILSFCHDLSRTVQ